jgi:hypothetical protein
MRYAHQPSTLLWPGQWIEGHLTVTVGGTSRAYFLFTLSSLGTTTTSAESL